MVSPPDAARQPPRAYRRPPGPGRRSRRLRCVGPAHAHDLIALERLIHQFFSPSRIGKKKGLIDLQVEQPLTFKDVYYSLLPIAWWGWSDFFEIDEVAVRRGRDRTHFHSRFGGRGDRPCRQVSTVSFDSAEANSSGVPATTR